jgi:hypothetical protein
MKALEKLKTASAVGVNREQFSNLVIEAKSAVNDALNKLPEGELKHEIQAAMEAYTDASIGWAQFGGDTLTQLRGGDGTLLRLKQKYKFKSWAYNGKVYDEGGPMESVERTNMLNAIWQEAGRHVDRAELLTKE